MLRQVGNFLLHRNTLFVVYFLVAVIAALQLVSTGKHVSHLKTEGSHDILSNASITAQFEGKEYTDYNNYVVFRNSFFHLIKGEDLYAIYPDEQWDLYKYSPAFSLFMGAIAWMPDVAGLILWNLLNALVLFFAISKLPVKERTRSMILWFVLLELLTSLQNAQSNGLIAGLMIAAYAVLQRGKIGWAAFFIVAATFIKPYGAIGLCLFLFYPHKLKSTWYIFIWGFVFTLIPLVATPLPVLIDQYKSWLHLMAADQSASYGLSVMGWLHSWFGLDNMKSYVTVAGLLLFLLPLVRLDLYTNKVYRMCMLASMLVWVIIFNHKAESPTFIIAVAGAGIWYFATEHKAWRTVLLVLVFVGTCLSPTDIFPAVIKQNFFKPYVIKAIPCIILWVAMIFDLLTLRKEKMTEMEYSLS